MKKKDFGLALLVVIIWGANFTVIKLGLEGVPSMLLVALRYVFTALPAAFFIKRPAVEFRYWVVYGLTVGVGEFGCLFYAMEIGMPAGLASVTFQTQAFFTLFFAALLLKEKISARQVIGLMVAATGLYCIGGVNGDHAVAMGPLFLTLLGAAFFALSNVIARLAAQKTASRGEKLDMFSFVVWSSFVPPLPLLGMALMLDTPQTLINVLKDLTGMSIFAVLFLAFCSTLFCFGTWSMLLARYPAGMVAPLSLLVPVTGLFTAGIVLGEQLSPMQLVGSLLIILGLVWTHFDLLPKKSVRRTGEPAN